MNEISFLEWFFLGMPWELLVGGLTLAAVVVGVGVIAKGLRRLFRRD